MIDDDNDEAFSTRPTPKSGEDVSGPARDGNDSHDDYDGENGPAGNDVQHGGYEVGYGRPPKSSRFRKGQSGNPKGRRKGTRNFRTYVREELEQRVSVKKDGSSRTMPKVQVIAKQLVNMSMQGEIKSIEFLLKLADLMAPDPREAEVPKPMSDQERDILFRYLKSIGLADDDRNNGEDK